MVAAGAAEGDREPRLALADVGRQRELEVLVEVLEEAPGDRLGEDVVAYSVCQARQLAELVDVVRVLHEPDVEHEVGLERHAVLEAEADQLDREPVRLGGVAEPGEDPLAQLPQRQVGRVDDDVGVERTGSSRRRSWAIELAMPRWSASGWRWRVSKRQIRTSSRASRKTCGRIASLQCSPHRRERDRRVAGADVEDDCDLVIALMVGCDEISQIERSSPGRLSTTV